NNTITSSTSTATSKGDGIRMVGFGSASTVANFSKGTINANTITNFPSDAGMLIFGGNATSTGAPAGTYGTDTSTNATQITNNISDTAVDGLLLNSINGWGHANVRVLKNTIGGPIESPPSGTVYGIRVAEGNINSSGDSTCLEISGNTTAGNDDGAGTKAPG